jgi:hypothetical protein
LVPFNPKTSPQSTYYLKSLEAAAPALTVTVSAAHVSSAGEIEAAVADLAQSPGGGLVIIPDIYTAIPVAERFDYFTGGSPSGSRGLFPRNVR